jgi:phenylalanyl-tRNA synthetase beta chain
VEGATVGWFGQLYPQLAAARKLKEAVLVGEIYLDRLFQLPLNKPAVREISRFQPVRRDFSLLIPEKVQWAALDATLGSLAAEGFPELVDWRVREKRAGDAGAYSLLLGATFQAHDRTLRDEELQAYSQRVIDAVSQIGARLRT